MTDTNTPADAPAPRVSDADAVREEINELRRRIEEEKTNNATAVVEADEERRTRRLVAERDRLREELAALTARTQRVSQPRLVDTRVVDPSSGVVLDAALVDAGVQTGVAASQVVVSTGEVVEVAASPEATEPTTGTLPDATVTNPSTVPLSGTVTPTDPGAPAPSPELPGSTDLNPRRPGR